VREAGHYLLAQPVTPESPRTIGHPDVARGQFVITVDPGHPPSALEIESVHRVTAGLSALPADVIYQPSLANRTFVDNLKQRFAGAVDVRWGRAGRTGRLDDGQPHFGAAGIGEGGFNFCTSGFIAVKNGFRGAVTAAHCYDFGFGPESNLWATSGPKLYGITGVAAPYPLYDMMRIDPGGQQFTNTIHTDPGTLTRIQVGKRDPVVGDVLCVSGSVTRAKCAIMVVDHGCVSTGPGGNTGGLTTGRRTGVLLAQGGDSGAPVYQQSGASGAIINGLLVGATFDQICFHRVSTVETQLGVTVAL
jgi:hypothetical protein